MIPERFATEYPRRCLELLETFEELAVKQDLVGTFAVMLASSVLLIPWERTKKAHPLKQEGPLNLQASLKAISKQKWLEAEFWGKVTPSDWRFSRIMGNPNHVSDWTDEKGQPSFSPEANTIESRSVDQVFRVLRNALAHGNIIYLDRNGQETAGERVEHLAFLSRYEESHEQRELNETYRLVSVSEAQFLPFVRAWASWVVSHQNNDADVRVS